MENKPPSLLISHGHGHFKEKQLIYDVVENDFRVLNNPIMSGYNVLASSYGWLVLVNPITTQCCLWNPLSMQTINLPDLELACFYGICVLSKPPTEPDCHILFNTGNTVEQSFCRIGDDEFCHVEEIDKNGYMRKLRAVSSFNGKIYGLVDPGSMIMTIHFVGKTLEFRPIMMVVDDDHHKPWRVPQLSRQISRWYEDVWFVESSCGGKLELLVVKKIFLCRYMDDGLEFRVFKIDMDRMTCVELDNIGQRAIFVSHNGGGFCCGSSTKIKPNSIYYTDQYGKYLYIYELENSSTTSLLPSNLGDCNSVTSWVEPQIFPQIFQ